MEPFQAFGRPSRCQCCDICARILAGDEEAALEMLHKTIAGQPSRDKSSKSSCAEDVSTHISSQSDGISDTCERKSHEDEATGYPLPGWAACRRSCSTLSTGTLRCSDPPIKRISTNLKSVAAARSGGKGSGRGSPSPSSSSSSSSPAAGAVARTTAAKRFRRMNAEWGRSVLHVASACSQPDIVGLLILHGIPVGVRSALSYWGGLTPLHEAAAARSTQRSLAVVWMLISAGASLHSTTRTMCYTPMHWACSQGEKSIATVAMLLHHPDGLDSALRRNAVGQSAIHGALDRLPARNLRTKDMSTSGGKSSGADSHADGSIDARHGGAPFEAGPSSLKGDATVLLLWSAMQARLHYSQLASDRSSSKELQSQIEELERCFVHRVGSLGPSGEDCPSTDTSVATRVDRLKHQENAAFAGRIMGLQHVLASSVRAEQCSYFWSTVSDPQSTCSPESSTSPASLTASIDSDRTTEEKDAAVADSTRVCTGAFPSQSANRLPPSSGSGSSRAAQARGSARPRGVYFQSRWVAMDEDSEVQEFDFGSPGSNGAIPWAGAAATTSQGTPQSSAPAALVEAHGDGKRYRADSVTSTKSKIPCDGMSAGARSAFLLRKAASTESGRRFIRLMASREAGREQVDMSTCVDAVLDASSMAHGCWWWWRQSAWTQRVAVAATQQRALRPSLRGRVGASAKQVLERPYALLLASAERYNSRAAHLLRYRRARAWRLKRLQWDAPIGAQLEDSAAGGKLDGDAATGSPRPTGNDKDD